MTTMIRTIFLLALLLMPMLSSAYRMEGGEFYAGAGFGMDVNVARMTKPSSTPGLELPLLASVDYLIDSNWGVFGSVVPTFAASNVGMKLFGGAKYWFTQFDFPLYPYVSLAFVPSFNIPFTGPTHINLGLSPGVGASYFVVSKFRVGAHLHFNPSVAWAAGASKFEFAVMPFFDLTLRV